MSNTIRTFEPETGDFMTEAEIQEAETERGADYLGDGNDDNDENDGWVMTFEDQTLGDSGGYDNQFVWEWSEPDILW